MKTMNIDDMFPEQHSFEENWDFQLDYYTQVENILKRNAGHFVSVTIADEFKDKKQATDFVVIIDGGEISVRIRRDNCKFRDLTIRSVNKGMKTEIHKIMEGFSRYYLYCWTKQKRITEWIFVDLDKFRESGLLESPRSDINNFDGTLFKAYSIQELHQNDCLIAKQLENF